MVDGVGENEVDGTKIGAKMAKSKSQGKSKNKNLVKALAQSFGSRFFTFRVIEAFTESIQACIKPPILHHHDSDCHIQIKTNISGYTINGVFSQLTLDNSG